MATTLLYLQDFDINEGTAKVIGLNETEDDRLDVELDQTCFYPRGGGQDWDTGMINSFTVEEVRLDESGVAHHIGQGQLALGDTVNLKVDTKRRDTNTRLHSGGHLIDMAVSELYPDWVPAKGAHYTHMSFVEYQTSDIPAETSQTDLQQKIDQLLKAEITNSMRLVDRVELEKICRHVPEYLPSNKPTRVVLYGDFGVPCGGTHVRKLSDIGKLEVTRIKTKKGLTKVSYRVEGIN